MRDTDKITARLLEGLQCPDLLESLAKLSPSDLNSLLMALFGRLAGKLEPKDLLKQYANNRYAAPSDCDPVAYHELEVRLLSLGRENGFKPILLSPAGLFGSCSAMAPVSQDKIVSAARGVELLADPTNMLALHIASGLKEGTMRNDGGDIHYCAAQRLSRVQAHYPKGFFPHFGVFCLVSSGRDTGSYAFERRAMVKHLGLCDAFLRTRHPGRISLALRGRGGYPDGDGFFDAIWREIGAAFPDLEVRVAERDLDNAYYRGINVKFYLPVEGEPVEIGDVGFVDWTQRLLGGKKERMLISAMGMERVLRMGS